MMTVDNINVLRQRLQQLETIEREYLQLKRLIDYAAENNSVTPYSGNIVLYVDISTHRILDASDGALEFLDYQIDPLRELLIEQLEQCDSDTDAAPITYIESAHEEQIYKCSYRHREGYLLPVQVHKRRLMKDGIAVWHYFRLNPGFREVKERG
jgi:hypothetical protein